MNKFNENVFSIKNLFIKHQSFILFSIIVLILPIFLSYVPYVNLVYTLDKGVLIYLLMIIVFIGRRAIFVLGLGIVLLFLSLFFLLLGFAILAEQIGNIIFFLLIVGVFLVISEHSRKTKQ